MHHERTTTAHLCYDDAYFDFIYIDADHRYESTKADLTNWFPKLRKGGVIAGHDYVNKICRNGDTFGVIQAVSEFRNNNREIIEKFATFGSDMNECWLIKIKD